MHTLCILFPFAGGIWCPLDSSFRLYQVDRVRSLLIINHQSRQMMWIGDCSVQIARSLGALLSDTVHTLLDRHVLDRDTKFVMPLTVSDGVKMTNIQRFQPN